MAARFRCPYCSTAVAPAESPAGGRVVCPRCGETFAPTPADAIEDDAPAAAGDGPPADGTRRSLLTLAMLGVCLAAAVAAAGVYGLTRATPERPRPRLPPIPAATGVVPPLSVRGLAYLPAGSNVVFAAQFAGVETAANEAKSTPRDLLARAGVPAELFASLDQFGLPVEAIDHVAGGLQVGAESPIPRAVVAVVLRSAPADAAAVRAKLNAAPVRGQPGQFTATVRGYPLSMQELDPRVYLFATDAADLAPPADRIGGGHLAPGVCESMAKVDPSAAAWAATDRADWAKKPAVVLGLRLLGDRVAVPADKLAAVRALAAEATVGPPPAGRVWALGGDGRWAQWGE